MFGAFLSLRFSLSAFEGYILLEKSCSSASLPHGRSQSCYNEISLQNIIIACNRFIKVSTITFNITILLNKLLQITAPLENPQNNGQLNNTYNLFLCLDMNISRYIKASFVMFSSSLWVMTMSNAYPFSERKRLKASSRVIRYACVFTA